MLFRFNTAASSASTMSEVNSGYISYDAHDSDTQRAGAKNSRSYRFAVDFAYTLNHAIVCTLTDPITDVPIGAAVQNIMAGVRGSNEKISARDVLHELKPAHVGSHLKDTFTLKKQAGEKFSPATSWLAGEFAGDFGAVPVVVALEHYAPSLVKGIGKAAEPFAKPIFMRSAERSAKAEFKLAGMQADGQEFQSRVDELYHKEIEGLPKAIMWTGISPAINILMQKTVMGSKAPITDLLAGKIIGTTTTSALTLGLRATSPSRAQKWDSIIGEKAEKPISSVISRLTGVDKDDIKTGVAAKIREHSKEQDWTGKTSNRPPTGIER